ncbi:type II toxin-antitoxin system RelE/ParE family toxin [archaeon]|nr:type II toxin-antitoxin system RelE/ParE family toxin [archaeon]
MYEIEFSESAEKQLYKLEKQVQIRIVSTLDRIRVRPYPFVKKLVGSPYFRLRVGDYRVILDIIDDRLLIFVIELGHRSNIYK